MEYSIIPWIGTGEDAPAGSVQQPAPTAFLNRLFQSLNRVLVHLHRLLGLSRLGVVGVSGRRRFALREWGIRWQGMQAGEGNLHGGAGRGRTG